MNIAKNTTLALFIGILLLTSSHVRAADMGANMKIDELLPALSISTRKEKTNFCPVCKRDRSICHSESEEAKNNPNSGKKACKIYNQDSNHFISGPVRPFNCKICRNKVNMPKKGAKCINADSDLCPHPTGNVKYQSDIVICPKCGFSAFQKDFRQQQSPQIKSWVMKNLAPEMGKTLHIIFGQNAKIKKKDLIALFAKQEEMPDTIRCLNAYAIYRRKYQQGDQDVNSVGLARMAWLTAWAHRREISAPIADGMMLASVRKVLAIIKKDDLDDDDVEEGIRLLTKYYLDHSRFDILDRQVMRIVQAGYYNRLGLNYWAAGVLNQVTKEATKQYHNPGSNPWLQTSLAKSMPTAERLKYVQKARQSLLTTANNRLQCIKQENRFMGYSVELIVAGLKKGLYKPEEVPAYMYLVGEFERRRELHSRGLLWLDAANQVKGKGQGLEYLAPKQVDLLKRYVRDRKIKPRVHPAKQKDWQLLQHLARKVQTYNAKKDALTSVPPAPAK